MMIRIGTLALAVGLVAGGTLLASNNPWEDLNRAGNRYQNDTNRAGYEYNKDMRTAQERYYREVQKAQQDYQRDMQRAYRGGYPDYGDIQDANRDYSRDMGRTQQRYGTRVAKAREDYYKAMQRARERYQRAQNEYYRDVYDWEHRGRSRTGNLWDRVVGRNRHYEDWYGRNQWSSPRYGRDYSDYYWDTGYWNGYNGTNNWRPYNNRDRYIPTTDDRRVTYWNDSRGGTGYYYPHEDDRLGNSRFSLSVGVGTPFPGYVNYDPYTYGYNPRGSYPYYRDYRMQDRRLRYNNQPSFQLAGSTNYYGDSFLYGNLYIPFN